jgi:hypothetical protein
LAKGHNLLPWFGNSYASFQIFADVREYLQRS